MSIVVRQNKVSHARLWTKWPDPRGRLVTGIDSAERRDRQTASQEIKHEPEEERPFLKPVGQSTQQDDPGDDNDADGQCLDVSPLLAREIEPCAGRSERGQAELHPAKATPPRIRAQLVREGARWHCDSGEQGDAPRSPERIGEGDSVTMRLRAERDSDQ